MDNDFMNDYDYEKVQKKLMNSIRYEGYEEGLQKGIEQGIEQGAQNKSIEVVKLMLEKNIDINTISEVTGLTIDEIDKLNNH